ncbi:MAG: cellulase family glycosylhydrolase [Bacteroidales bacterium]|nr:cellulase family glycosylhydrolase [Bacteroidales bacterium]
MKFFLNILALLAAMTVSTMALSCDGPVPEPEPVQLTTNPSELKFEAQGGTQQLTITCGIKPIVTCSDSWISLSEGSYASNSLTVSVKATENPSAEIRSTQIRIIGDKQSLMLPVTQGVVPVKLTVDKSSLSFERFGGETTVKVTSSSQPTVSTDATWCLVEAGTIDSNRETLIQVAAAANRTTASRKGNVTISCGSEKITITISEDAYSVSEASTTAVTPKMVFDAMGPGWNMGNHMDAISNGIASETVWGNPKCTQATFDKVKAAGFKAVRICTTWEGHIGKAPAYRLEEKWLSRVEEIVGYAEKAGLVAILNTHHDESYWLDIAKAWNNSAQNEKTKDEIFCVWTQIAQRFKDKGEWLVLESFNEIQDGGWGWSDSFKANPKAQYDVLNSWNQIFVDAVRSTGSVNATRWLGIPGYAASPMFTIAGLKLPKDYTTANRLIVAVHDYDPYNYTLNNPLVRQWGHTADADKRCDAKDEENVVAVFEQLKAAYIDKGIPVYLGEMGCSRHSDEDYPYQKYYMEYFCKAAADRQLPMYVWDNGAKGVGSEKHGYIDHGTGAFVDAKAEELIGIMVKAVTTKDAAYTLQSVYDSAP